MDNLQTTILSVVTITFDDIITEKFGGQQAFDSPSARKPSPESTT